MDFSQDVGDWEEEVDVVDQKEIMEDGEVFPTGDNVETEDVEPVL